jgi:hypothetical protein
VKSRRTYAWIAEYPPGPTPVAVSLLNVSKKRQVTVMNILLIIAVVLAVLFFLGGGMVPSMNFLIWVGVVLLILAAVGYFMGRRRT